MKFIRIKLKILPVLAALSAMGWVTSCNNSDESANNSTTSPTDSAAGIAGTDNTMTPPADPSTANTGKKKGKVSIAMNADNKTDKMSSDKTGYYNYAEVSPAYNGGQTAIENYVNNNLQYPQDAIDNNAEGTVRVQFGIDENGNISNVKTMGNKIGYGLEEEAVRVIADMPKWTPGQVKGKNVKTWIVLPVTYRIEG